MLDDKLKDLIADRVMDEDILNQIIVLDGDACAYAAVGLTDDYNVVYDFERMVEGFMKYDGMTEEEAVEWIDYNVLRTIDYLKVKGDVIAPVMQMASFVEDMSYILEQEEKHSEKKSLTWPDIMRRYSPAEVMEILEEYEKNKEDELERED